MAEPVKPPRGERLIPEMFEAPPDWPEWLQALLGRPDCLVGTKTPSQTESARPPEREQDHA